MTNINGTFQQSSLNQQLGGRRLHRIGPFRARLQPTPFARSVELPERLNASLLTHAVNTHGYDYVECPQTAAARRPVRLVRAGSKTLVIPHEFVFYLPGCALIQQLGLFDDQGQLRYFGHLASSRQSFERPEEFRFEGGAVEVSLHGNGTF
jgi:hypothetical protein